MKKTKKKKEVKTSISLPKDLWEELKIEAIKKNKTLSQLITDYIRELKRIKSLGVIEEERGV